jgi:hypothetical protein
VDRILFFRLFFPWGIELTFTPVETNDVNEFMRCDVEHQRMQFYKGMCPLYRIEDSVVLETNPVKAELISVGSALILTETIFTQMGERLLVHFMFFEMRQRFYVISMTLPLTVRQTVMTSQKNLGMNERFVHAGNLRRAEMLYGTHRHPPFQGNRC